MAYCRKVTIKDDQRQQIKEMLRTAMCGFSEK